MFDIKSRNRSRSRNSLLLHFRSMYVLEIQTAHQQHYHCSDLTPRRLLPSHCHFHHFRHPVWCIIVKALQLLIEALDVQNFWMLSAVWRGEKTLMAAPWKETHYD